MAIIKNPSYAKSGIITSPNGIQCYVEYYSGINREGTDKSGNKWSNPCMWSYGYVIDTLGVDGDEVDCIIGYDFDNLDGLSFVVSQVKFDQTLDEHKLMLGFPTKEIAERAYKDFYGSKGNSLFGSISTAYDWTGIKDWLSQYSQLGHDGWAMNYDVYDNGFSALDDM